MVRQDTVSVNNLIVSRLDRIDSVLDKQNNLLDDIKRQTTLTNGRVTVLERDIADSKMDRKDLRTSIEVLQKNDYRNEGIRTAIRDEKADEQKTVRYWFTESRAIIFFFIMLITTLASIGLGVYSAFFR